MSAPVFVVSGTDTEIGKTVFSAGLAGLLDAYYWKPVQSGLDGPSDSATVARLGGLAPERILPEAYRLQAPLSPHRSAELEDRRLDPDAIAPPAGLDRPLVVEGAGGLMVPLTRETLLIDVFARWRRPVILCARTALGTINHTLLSLEALRARGIACLGVAFIGPENPDNMRTICDFSGAPSLGWLPPLDPLTPDGLRAAMTAGFHPAAFLGEA